MADSTPPSKIKIPTSNTQPFFPPSRYRGVGSRRGKWRAQVYSWVYFKTIRLDAYSTPKMAAIAYDVGALAFNGENEEFNFSNAIWSHLVPKSTVIIDVRDATVVVASKFGVRPEVADAFEVPSQEIGEYVDEYELFNMPQVLIKMAEGLMVSPPRFGPPEFDEP